MQAMLQIFVGHTGQHCPGGGGSGFSHGGLTQAMLQITDTYTMQVTFQSRNERFKLTS